MDDYKINCSNAVEKINQKFLFLLHTLLPVQREWNHLPVNTVYLVVNNLLFIVTASNLVSISFDLALNFINKTFFVLFISSLRLKHPLKRY